MNITAAILTMTLSVGAGAGKAQSLVPAEVNGLKLKVPKGWKGTVEDGTHRWESANGKESFSLDVFTPEGEALGPGECVDKLVKALGGEGWERQVVGGQPAARKTSTDALEDGKKVTTFSHVGCDGRTRWALTYVMDARRKVAPPVKRIVESIRFASASASKAVGGEP